MMSERAYHKNKTPSQRAAYHKYIQRLNTEPTIDDQMSFEDSNNTDEEFSEPTSKRRRSIPLSEKARSHLSEYWFNWLISVFALALIYLVYDSKIDLVTIDSKLTNQSGNIEEINDEVEKLNETNHEQDLLIQKNYMILEFMSASMEKDD